jgi:NAD(P) transhydrogenase subunit alpha
VTEEMVRAMKPGSVIVDLAAEQGGNCACTAPGKDIVWNGVTIIGPINLPSSMPVHASQLYAKNITSLMQLLIKDKALQINFGDDIVDAACITHGVEIRNQRIKEALQTATV